MPCRWWRRCRVLFRTRLVDVRPGRRSCKSLAHVVVSWHLRPRDLRAGARTEPNPYALMTNTSIRAAQFDRLTYCSRYSQRRSVCARLHGFVTEPGHDVIILMSSLDLTPGRSHGKYCIVLMGSREAREKTHFAKRKPNWEPRALHDGLQLASLKPLEDQSRSACPQCDKSRSWYDQLQGAHRLLLCKHKMAPVHRHACAACVALRICNRSLKTRKMPTFWTG
jgi:hypothetical protein